MERKALKALYGKKEEKTRMMRYSIYTLGCKVNQYETQAMERMLRERGLEPSDGGEADVVIVNTCAVTAESGRKSRQAIRRLMQQNPAALVAVCGCYSQLEPEAVRALGADVVFGTSEREKFVDAITSGAETEYIDDPFRRLVIEPLPAGSVAGRTRALLRIQDGCDNFCSYCIIPYSRGRVRSLPLDAAAEQAAALAAKGFREIVVTGIEIASYGKELPGKPGLAEAVRAVAKAAPEARIHLGSLEPTVVTESFCETLTSLGNVCRHFHLSLQSGCDDTLARMRRKYDTAQFYEACCLLRRYFPGASLTADLITGFPGETEADFDATLAFLEKCAFSFVHCFPYSPRPGTKAADMPEQHSHAVKEARVRRAMALVERMQRDYLNGCVGQTLPVLFENAHEGHADNYCLVSVEAPQERGTVQNVQITGVDDEKLVGFVV